MEPNLNDPEIKSEINPPLEASPADHKSSWIVYALIITGALLLIGGGIFVYSKFYSPQVISYNALENFSKSDKIAKINDKAAEINLHLKMNVLKASAEELAEEVKPERKLPKLPSPIASKDEMNEPPILGLSIETPKDVYKLNEPFEGSLISTVKEGESFPYLVFRFLEHDQVTHGSLLSNKIMEDSYLGKFSKSIRAFEMDNNSYSYPHDGFSEPGTYTYTYQAYKASECGDLNLDDIDCVLDVEKEDLASFTPLATVTKTITVSSEEFDPLSGNNASKLSENANTNEKNILDCVGSEDGNCMTPFLDQFTKNLESCTPSTGETPIGFEAFMGLLRGYEVKGLLDGNCVIDFWFLDIPVEKMPPEADPIPAELLNKKMTCSLTNDQLNIEAVGKWVGCEGPLKVELDKL